MAAINIDDGQEKGRPRHLLWWITPVISRMADLLENWGVALATFVRKRSSGRQIARISAGVITGRTWNSLVILGSAVRGQSRKLTGPI